MNIIRSSTYLIPKELVSNPNTEFFVPNPMYGKYSKEPLNIYYYEEQKDYYSIPRNCNINRFLRANPSISVIDITAKGQPLSEDIVFKGALKPFQKKVFDKVVNNPGVDEIVVSPCGSGKTVIGLAIAVKLKVCTAILVPTEQLMEQWVSRIKHFLNYDAGMYCGHTKVIKEITVFSIASMFKKDSSDESFINLFDRFGLLLCDETHRLGAVQWGNAVKCFKAVKRIGLTATPKRPDELDVIMHFHIGEISNRITHKELVESGAIVTPEVLILNFKGPSNIYKIKPYKKDFDFANSCTEMAVDPSRNELILKIIKKSTEAGRKTLVLINRLSQIDCLLDGLTPLGLLSEVGVLKGNVKDKDAVLSKSIILGIVSLVKEGLDRTELDTVVISVPVSDYGMVEQILGRVSRVDPNKRDALVVDIHDVNCKPLMKMAYKRLNVYKKLGCKFRSKNGNS